MQTKTLETLLIEANELVKRLSYNESLELINNTQTVIIDVREESEVFNLGLIKNAVHIPRGLIEFKLSPNSQNNPVLINDNKIPDFNDFEQILKNTIIITKLIKCKKLKLDLNKFDLNILNKFIFQYLNSIE